MAKLYFRHGAVGSAKTLNLLAVAHSYEFQGKKVIIAKPHLDTRFGAAEVKSRANLSKEAHLIIAPDTKLCPTDFVGVSCLVVDEAQFLAARHIDMLRVIADSGCPVICYGLRTDFRSQLFAGSKRLMEIADSIEEVKTTCTFCNKKAVLSLKLVDDEGCLSGAQVDLGCEEKYVPVCSRHFGAKTNACEGADEFYPAGIFARAHKAKVEAAVAAAAATAVDAAAASTPAGSPDVTLDTSTCANTSFNADGDADSDCGSGLSVPSSPERTVSFTPDAVAAARAHAAVSLPQF